MAEKNNNFHTQLSGTRVVIKRSFIAFILISKSEPPTLLTTIAPLFPLVLLIPLLEVLPPLPVKLKLLLQLFITPNTDEVVVINLELDVGEIDNPKEFDDKL